MIGLGLGHIREEAARNTLGLVIQVHYNGDFVILDIPQYKFCLRTAFYSRSLLLTVHFRVDVVKKVY